jgi:hypothetical protein
LKEGNNVIAVQVEDNGGGGGFYGESGMKITFKTGKNPSQDYGHLRLKV